ncbi:MAG: energy transducer TonB, partial [Nitrospinota bacterium]
PKPKPKPVPKPKPEPEPKPKPKPAPPPVKEKEPPPVVEEELLFTPESSDTDEEDLAFIQPENTPESTLAEEPEPPVTPSLSDKKIGMSVDDTRFPYLWYLNSVKNKIDSHWDPAEINILRGTTLKVTMRFTLHRSGKITNVFIETPSGVPLYDNSTLRAIHSSEPFPPLPEGFVGASLDIHFDFEYNQPKR